MWISECDLSLRCSKKNINERRVSFVFTIERFHDRASPTSASRVDKVTAVIIIGAGRAKETTILLETGACPARSQLIVVCTNGAASKTPRRVFSLTKDSISSLVFALHNRSGPSTAHSSHSNVELEVYRFFVAILEIERKDTQSKTDGKRGRTILCAVLPCTSGVW